MPKKQKVKIELLDGWGNPKEIEQVRKAIRQVWSRGSNSRKIAKKRCMNDDGFYVCEKCNKMTPKIEIHHLHTVGDLNDGYLARLFCPSSQLWSLCPSCHGKLTRAERKKNE